MLDSRLMPHTRAQILALLVPRQPIVCIKNTNELRTYNAVALYNAVVKDSVACLQLRFVKPSTQTLADTHRLLSRMDLIDTLVLDISATTQRQASALLRCLRLPALDLLSTSLSHKAVIEFLKNNVQLRTLVISDIAACKCSLLPPPQIPGLRLHELSGPSSCVAHFAKMSSIDRVTARYSDCNDSLCVLLKVLAFSSPQLVYLSLEICVNRDPDVLATVVQSTPNLSELALIEKVFDFQHVFPWSSENTSRLLSRLKKLRRFTLSTPAPLVLPPGNSTAEKKLVSRWFPYGDVNAVDISYHADQGSYRSVWVRRAFNGEWVCL
ncbi:hypothetical protein H0H93_000448 [Arthromyces matolae]|nr:hypothetical protein H0H93_000448 [Arthromyces matolae]